MSKVIQSFCSDLFTGLPTKNHPFSTPGHSKLKHKFQAPNKNVLKTTNHFHKELFIPLTKREKAIKICQFGRHPKR
jgi:hypothetical protein